MSEKPVLSLNDVLHQTTWSTQGNGLLVGLFQKDAVTQTFTEDDLAALHPLLPLAVREQQRWWTNLTTDAPLYGHHVAVQLHYLTQDPLLLPGPLSARRHYAVALEGLHRAAESGMAILTALSYAVTTRHSVDFVIPTSKSSGFFVVPFSWLDEHFPGWLQRFEAAEFLGLSGEALITHVLTTASVTVLPETSIEGVAFD